MRLSRTLLYKTHCLINIFCLLMAAVFSTGFGFFTLLTFILPLIGVITFLVNNGKRVAKGYYLLGGFSNCFSLLMISGRLFDAATEQRFWYFIYFTLTTMVTIGVIYCIFLNKIPGFFHKISLSRLLGIWLISIFFYRTILTNFFVPNPLLFLSYFIWVLNLTLTMITCFDVKFFLYKRT